MRKITLKFILFIMILLIIDGFINNNFISKCCGINGNLDFSYCNVLIKEDIKQSSLYIYKIKKQVEKAEKQKRIKCEFNKKINSLTFENRKSDFLAYKEILEEYKYYPYLEIPKTVYDEYDTNEIKVFQRLIAAETTGGDFESKCNVASVVWNRLHSEKYPDSIIDVIYQKNGSVQFSPTFDGRIDIVEVTEDDILAVEYTYMFGSTAYDCIAFDHVSGSSWNKNKLEEVFTDSIRHTFYR